MVPLKFRAQVKADIEADIMKGNLERVPDGEPDTLCSRQVIQEKKNGKARRTVDLSYLSKHGSDESHYTSYAPMITKGILGNVTKWGNGVLHRANYPQGIATVSTQMPY